MKRIYALFKRLLSKKEISKDLFHRPHKLEGVTIDTQVSCGKQYVTANWDKDKIVREVFIRGGGCQSNQSAVCRLLSLCLRYGLHSEVLKQLEKTEKCRACANVIAKLDKDKKRDYPHSCADSIYRAIKPYLKGI